jgi:Domain of unknown function DUF29
VGHLRIVIHYLLKWQFQPERRSRSWKASIWTHREQLVDIFSQSPSLERNARRSLPEVYDRAVRKALDETGLARECFPAACPYTFDQIMDFDFLPEAGAPLASEP